MSYGMKMLSIIVSIFFAIVALTMSAVSYGLYNDNKRLVVKNQLLTELYDVSIKNVEGLEKVIDEQNAKIDKFKKDSITFETKVHDLNAEVEKLNNEKESYVKMEASPSGKEEASSEEAMEWLKQQAPSL
jgi:peptidoglycan hydrolase CwlO-like protein